mmetsp:Transcript_64075/g.111695  ORF Transcript_64075/g.111695 Transcript_64075/m.111695 type:complete len:344 (+) Transcript_64075:791-1822(+)
MTRGAPFRSAMQGSSLAGCTMRVLPMTSNKSASSMALHAASTACSGMCCPNMTVSVRNGQPHSGQSGTFSPAYAAFRASTFSSAMQKVHVPDLYGCGLRTVWWSEQMRPRIWPCNSFTFSEETPALRCKESMFCVTTAPSLPICSNIAKKLCAGFGAAFCISETSDRFIFHQPSATSGSVLKFCTVILAALKLPQMEPLSPSDGLRKGVIPDSTEIPAPVSATTHLARRTNSAICSTVVNCSPGAGASNGISIIFSASLRSNLVSFAMLPNRSAGTPQSPEGSRTVRVTVCISPDSLCRSWSICFSTASNFGAAASPYKPRFLSTSLRAFSNKSPMVPRKPWC